MANSTSSLTSLGRSAMGAMRRAFAGVSDGGMLGTLFQWNTWPRLGTDNILKAYTTMPWLRAFEQKVATDVASTTWLVMVPTRKRGNQREPIRDITLQRAMTWHARQRLLGNYARQDNLREIVNHPLSDLLTKGNEFFSGLTAMQLSQTYIDLVGELVWLLKPNGLGMPTDALPVPPTWVQALPRQTGGNYRIQGPNGTWEVPRDEVFFAYQPAPHNPFGRGTGLAQVLSDELETDEYAARFSRDWFKNRAIPPVLISGVGVGLDELTRLEEKWLAKHNRTGAGWLPQFLGKDVKVHQLSQTLQSMQLGSLRKDQRDTIRLVYGIPPEVIGDVSNSNRSTIESADYIYQKRVIVPRLEFLRAEMQERLAPLFDERLVLDYVSPVQEDREFQLKVYTAAPHMFSADEWRDLGGREALENGKGKVYAINHNVAIIASLEPTPEDEPEPEPAPPALPAREEDEDDEPGAELLEDGQQAGKASREAPWKATA